ncbi:Scr1 family TA system antitoxin-like transcriptional regulator [Streptomyces sp. NBC_00249]|uniref:helix-turn-helix domain-containing protein n=1 Tax=Streptomyces sp. NBC_00249 TaxID=2975690 RepID=UPI00225BC00D|nr:Scr1 family TA system antitoxin-like transcriptional regulator [Streptomyces sp. NBC_00249]MCX5199130.1 Scr1 family TA system antitoxin-like transcriptional regulator [Streptomyces sp. NBC_00249]
MPPKKRTRPNATTMKMVGMQVATARSAKDLTQKQLAKLIGQDTETVASIEQGRRALMPNVAELMDLHLGLPGLLSVAAHEMPGRDASPPWSEEYMDLEQRAITLNWYESMVIPGILQTESQMRALFRCRVPAFPPDEIETLTVRRLARVQILHRQYPPNLTFVISEAALRDRIGGDAIYGEQLRHLLVCMEIPHVAVQVLPLGQTYHPGLSGSFTMLETPEHEHVGYFEGQRGSKLVTDPDDVSILAQRYAMLRTQALNPQDTKGLLNCLLGEL